MAILRSGRPRRLVHRWTTHRHLSTTILGEHMFEELIHRIDDLQWEMNDTGKVEETTLSMLEDLRYEIADAGDILEWAGYDFAEIV